MDIGIPNGDSQEVVHSGTTPLPGGRSAKPLLVVAVAGRRDSQSTLAREVIGRVEPRIRHLIRLTDPAMPAPQFRNAGHGGSRIATALQECERVVLVSSIRAGGTLGKITAWHHETRRRGGETNSITENSSGLSVLQLTDPPLHRGLYHLPFWLEDEIPPGGLDFIGIQVSAIPVKRGESQRLRRHLPLITSALTGILWRIVREVSDSQEELRQAA